jgi:hypothetical protein
VSLRADEEGVGLIRVVLGEVSILPSNARAAELPLPRRRFPSIGIYTHPMQ